MLHVVQALSCERVVLRKEGQVGFGGCAHVGKRQAEILSWLKVIFK